MRRPVLSLLLLAACGTTYRVDHPADGLPALRLTEVRASAGSTVISFAYRPDEARRVGIQPPGHADAFRITSVDGARSWALTGASGIPTLPERATVGAGQTLAFTLTFEALPAEVRLFDVGEGGAESEDERAWRFRGVRLGDAHSGW